MLEIVATEGFNEAHSQHLRINSVDIRSSITKAMKPAKTKREKENKKNYFDWAVTELKLDIDALLGALGCNR